MYFILITKVLTSASGIYGAEKNEYAFYDTDVELFDHCLGYRLLHFSFPLNEAAICIIFSIELWWSVEIRDYKLNGGFNI